MGTLPGFNDGRKVASGNSADSVSICNLVAWYRIGLRHELSDERLALPRDYSDLTAASCARHHELLGPSGSETTQRRPTVR